jgi:nucleotide-binding universal stress UspA family protein
VIQTILVPLDGSALSERILPFVKEAARRADAEIILLTAVQAVGIWDATATAVNWEREEKAAHEYVKSAEERLQLDGLQVRSRALQGDPADAILTSAESEPAHLIAMSTHGRSGIMRWLVGSVADRVVQHSKVPVLLIRPREDKPDPSPTFDRILVPLDGSAVAAGILPFVKEYARLYDASLVLYHAVQPVAYPGLETASTQVAGDLLQEMSREGEAMLQEASRSLESEGFQVSTAVSLEPAADGILHAAEEAGATLIAIGTHGRSGLERTVLGSVANAVVRRSTLPTLIIHPTVKT